MLCDLTEIKSQSIYPHQEFSKSFTQLKSADDAHKTH